MMDEVVGVQSLDLIFGQDILRKIPDVHSDDSVASGIYRCRKYMSVIRVWKVQALDQIFESFDISIW